MTMAEILELARALGLKLDSLNKAEAVRAIQQAEGNFDCYGRASSGFCDQVGCLFRADCMAESTSRTQTRNKR